MSCSDFFDIAVSLVSKASKGELGKLRYKKIYAKALEYIDKEHKGATCSYPVKTKDGWSCIMSENGKNTVLYITEQKGQVSFWEKEI